MCREQHGEICTVGMIVAGDVVGHCCRVLVTVFAVGLLLLWCCCLFGAGGWAWCGFLFGEVVVCDGFVCFCSE